MGTEFVGLFLILATTIAGTVGPRDAFEERAILCSLLQVTLVHAEWSQALRLSSLVSISLISLVVAVRRRRLAMPHPSVVVVVAYLWIVQPLVAGVGFDPLLSSVIQAVGFLLLGGVVRGLRMRALRPLLQAAATWLIINAVAVTTERFAGVPAAWPRRDGSVVSGEGVNNLWSGAGGRAFGTTGWAITLGDLAALFTILVVWHAWRTRSPGWFVLAGLGVYIVATSGTRTAAIMLAVALVVALLSTFRRVVLLAPVAAFGVLLLAESVVGLRKLFGFGAESAGSSSVEHRSAIWDSVPRLLGERSFGEVLLGVGYPRSTDVLDSGLVEVVGESKVWDNELVHSLVGVGIVGVTVLAVAILTVPRRSGVLGACLMAAFVVGSLSYDTFTWRSLLVPFIVMLCLDFSPDRSPAEHSLQSQRSPSRRTAVLTPGVSLVQQN